MHKSPVAKTIPRTADPVLLASATDAGEASMTTLILGRMAPVRGELEPAPESSVNAEKPAERAREPRRVLLRVEIESKLGLGPSEHRSSKPYAGAEALPAKRARLRRPHM